MDKNYSIEQIIKQSVSTTLGKPKKTSIVETVLDKSKKVLTEASILMLKTFMLKTEKLSSKTKEAHYNLYKKHVDLTNKISVKLDAVNKDEADEGHSAFRGLKIDYVENKNSTVLHELYFSNISDLSSQIHQNSLVYMKLCQSFGDFDIWQKDFISTCLSSRDGWAICYYDGTCGKYMNCVIDGDSFYIPIACIPIIVIDMHIHSYYKDYLDDKKAYVISMMKELNWEIIELRVMMAEKTNLKDLFSLMPQQGMDPEKLKGTVGNEMPIGKDMIVGIEVEEEEKEPVNNNF